jgi:hypothetical protein
MVEGPGLLHHGRGAEAPPAYSGGVAPATPPAPGAGLCVVRANWNHQVGAGTDWKGVPTRTRCQLAPSHMRSVRRHMTTRPAGLRSLIWITPTLSVTGNRGTAFSAHMTVLFR